MPEQVVSATVKSKEVIQEGDEFDAKVNLDIPAFKSQYPTTVYVKDQDEYNNLKAGKVFSLKLIRGKLPDGKDGSRPWHYRWLWGGFAPASTAAPAQSANGTSTAPEGTGRAETDPRGLSIERQVAVKAVAEMVASGRIDPPQFGEWFTYLATLMAGTATAVPETKEIEEEGKAAV